MKKTTLVLSIAAALFASATTAANAQYNTPAPTPTPAPTQYGNPTPGGNTVNNNGDIGGKATALGGDANSTSTSNSSSSSIANGGIGGTGGAGGDSNSTSSSVANGGIGGTGGSATTGNSTSGATASNNGVSTSYSNNYRPASSFAYAPTAIPNANVYNCDGNLVLGGMSIVGGGSIGIPLGNADCLGLLEATYLRQNVSEEAQCHYLLDRDDAMAKAMKKAGTICGKRAVQPVPVYVAPRPVPSELNNKLDRLYQEKMTK